MAAYAKARAKQEGGKFRLLFMADEVGQFIGTDVNLMLNLQTLVEELGARCEGRVWVMVTSQEALDEVLEVVGHDFSKIMGRFNTRLSLSSSSVDEVIKRRVLDKEAAAAELLAAEYGTQSAVLKNLFAFEQSQSDLRGYASAAEFTESYPFVGYQFKLLPRVMDEIRRHGTSAKHMSTGERSMLSAFQESAQRLSQRSIGALAPFHFFFDTIAKDLEHGIVNVVNRAADAARNDEGLSELDVQVLKTLYLIRYVADVKATAGNIAILMADDMGCDVKALRDSVAAAFERLVRENYAARQGDTYNFLTDEEQDIARDIASTPLDAAEVTEQIKRVIFDGLFTARKHRKGVGDYPIDRFVDDSVYGQVAGGMKLNIITYAHELARATDGELAVKSTEQAIVVLADDNDYYRSVENAAKIRKYVRTRNVAALPPSTQDIVKRKQAEAAASDKEAANLIADALLHARCAVAGAIVHPRAAKPEQLLAAVLDELVGATFTRADFIDAPVEDASALARILAGKAQGSIEGTGGANERACTDMETRLAADARMHQRTTMGDLQRDYQAKPYGWREVDVAAVVARLILEQRATATLAGAQLSAGDRRLPEHLRGRAADKLVVSQRVAVNDALLKSARSLLREFAPGVAASDDEDGLVAAVKDALEEAQRSCRTLVADAYAAQPEGYPYPGRDAVAAGAHALAQVLECASDNEALLKAFRAARDELLDFAEDMERVRGFFPNQQRLFDASAALLSTMSEERVYLEGNAQAQELIAGIDGILRMDAPYARIHELSVLNGELTELHRELLNARRGDLLAGMENALAEVLDYLARARDEHPDAQLAGAGAAAERAMAQRRESAHAAVTLTRLDALSAQLSAWRDAQCEHIDNLIDAAQEAGVDADEPDGGDAQEQRPAGKKTKVLRREAVCPTRRLSSEADVDAYVEAIRATLLEALAEHDSVRLG